MDMAFPIAVFCVLLLRKHPKFESILFGKMIQKCPFVIPMYTMDQIPVCFYSFIFLLR